MTELATSLVDALSSKALAISHEKVIWGLFGRQFFSYHLPGHEGGCTYSSLLVQELWDQWERARLANCSVILPVQCPTHFVLNESHLGWKRPDLLGQNPNTLSWSSTPSVPCPYSPLWAKPQPAGQFWKIHVQKNEGILRLYSVKLFCIMLQVLIVLELEPHGSANIFRIPGVYYKVHHTFLLLGCYKN